VNLRLRQHVSWLVVAADLAGSAAGLLVIFSRRPQLGLVLLAVGTCALGFIRPRSAWACALAGAAGLALVCIVLPLAGIAAPFSAKQNAFVILLAVALAFAGAYLGALAGSLLKPPGRSAGH
jgi:hypothetical protein